MIMNGEPIKTDQKFSGHIYIFHAFDVGEDIDLERIRHANALAVRPLQVSKFFKNYHAPLPVEIPQPSKYYMNSSIHSFGVISLAYKISFSGTLEELRKQLPIIDAEIQEQSVIDCGSIYRLIKFAIKQHKFFQLRTSYVVLQVMPEPQQLNVVELKKQYGGIIASLLRFETETLSEYQKDEILKSGIGYYRGSLIVIDTQAAFVYEEEYDELLGLFEFANIQQLELQYYDRVLDQQLTSAYSREVRKLSLKSYLPFAGSLAKDPVTALGMLKVDISVIIERLKSSIKVAGEEYISEVYKLLIEKLELDSWKKDIDNKLAIIRDINQVYQDRIDAVREDLLSVLIIVLIFIELVVALFKG